MEALNFYPIEELAQLGRLLTSGIEDIALLRYPDNEQAGLLLPLSWPNNARRAIPCRPRSIAGVFV